MERDVVRVLLGERCVALERGAARLEDHRQLVEHAVEEVRLQPAHARVPADNMLEPGLDSVEPAAILV